MSDCAHMTRRDFIGTSACAGLALGMAPILKPGTTFAAASVSEVPDATGERMAAAEAFLFRPYRSKPVSNTEDSTWVQIDLGSSLPIESILLYPAKRHLVSGDGFPLRFCIECSEHADFDSSRIIADRTRRDYPHPEDRILRFRARGAAGRYVRLTATHLATKRVTKTVLQMAHPMPKEWSAALEVRALSLAKIAVMSEGVDVAERCVVTVDPAYGNPEDAQQLTRPPRPQGEGIVTDHPRNVTAEGSWRPVSYKAYAPRSGVLLKENSLFAKSWQGASEHLLTSFTTDEMLQPFRARAGKPVPAAARTLSPFWDGELPGSNAGRFLMGAGNSLRWHENSTLRAQMNEVVAGIAECRGKDGYIMGFPESAFFVSERGAYTRSWTTLGLIAAGYAGNTQAFELLRGYYDHYNTRPYRDRMLRGCIQGGQGMVANTQLYFTPVGKPDDVHVIQRYFQENYWLDALAAGDANAIGQYPYDRPHIYLATNLEAYLDMYRATGDERYLKGVLGGWQLYRDNWQRTGGSFSIIELAKNEPHSSPLYESLGETCGNAFWVLLNHRLHQLYPDDERYVTEIEKSLYNVLIANHAGPRGVRYYTMLVGNKDAPACVNTCCEGQGTRTIASLPEYIYSIANDGLYINLFAPSTIEWTHGQAAMRVELRSQFPETPDVEIAVSPSQPTAARLRVRVPSWATRSMPILVNDQTFGEGRPGTYVTLERTWQAGDTIRFTLPINFKMTRYTGVDQVAGRERFFLEYGPILMAALDTADERIALMGAARPEELIGRLQATDQPLHFTVPGFPPVQFVPYYEIDNQSFSCAPIVASTPLFF